MDQACNEIWGGKLVRTKLSQDESLKAAAESHRKKHINMSIREMSCEL
jgi:hypothetical protein